MVIHRIPVVDDAGSRPRPSSRNIRRRRHALCVLVHVHHLCPFPTHIPPGSCMRARTREALASVHASSTTYRGFGIQSRRRSRSRPTSRPLHLYLGTLHLNLRPEPLPLSSLHPPHRRRVDLPAHAAYLRQQLRRRLFQLQARRRARSVSIVRTIAGARARIRTRLPAGFRTTRVFFEEGEGAAGARGAGPLDGREGGIWRKEGARRARAWYGRPRFVLRRKIPRYCIP